MVLFGVVYLLPWSIWACRWLRSFLLAKKTELDVVIEEVPSSTHIYQGGDQGGQSLIEGPAKKLMVAVGKGES
jgi:hypothetical protein